MTKTKLENFLKNKRLYYFQKFENDDKAQAFIDQVVEAQNSSWDDFLKAWPAFHDYQLEVYADEMEKYD